MENIIKYKRTHPTLLGNNSQHCWMLHVASVQSLKPVKYLATCKRTQQLQNEARPLGQLTFASGMLCTPRLCAYGSLLLHSLFLVAFSWSIWEPGEGHTNTNLTTLERTLLVLSCSYLASTSFFFSPCSILRHSPLHESNLGTTRPGSKGTHGQILFRKVIIFVILMVLWLKWFCSFEALWE